MTHTDDASRVAAIGAYDVLDAPPRPELRALVELAALVCDVPMAAINLVTADEQRQVATVGFDAATCRREDSMCATVLSETAPVVVPDASRDPRFQDNPFVTGRLGRVRFYASHQLRTPQGVVIGALCVFDERPHELDPERVQALAGLAARVVDVLELELTGRRLRRAQEDVAASAQRLGEFARQVSHDLKNPLTGITMSLEMARDEADGTHPVDPAELLPLLDRAARGADRLQSMLDDLVQLARSGGTTPAG